MEHVRNRRNDVRLHAILFAGMALITLAGFIVMISILGPRM